MSSLWIKVAPLPKPARQPNRADIPTGCDKNNYIAFNGNYIWKYNVHEDEWSKIMHIPERWLVGDAKASAFDKDKTELYVYAKYFNNPLLVNIKLEGKTHQIFNVKHDGWPQSESWRAQMVIIDKKIHIIGAYGRHSEWDWKREKFYGKAKGLGRSGIIYTSTPKKQLLLFGGVDYPNRNSDNILDFDFKTGKWNKREEKLPNKECECTCTLAIQNNYIFIFGGRNSDNIYIYNLKNKTLRISKIKLPYGTNISSNVYKCIAINDELRKEMVVFGFARNEWKISNIDNHYFPPHYLLKIICSYYWNEMIYLLNRYTAEHWKINSFDIL